jgi:thymidine kinase
MYNKFTLCKGIMFDGKSEYLINQADRFNSKEVLAIKPKIHQRDGAAIYSRESQRKIPCLFAEEPRGIKELVDQLKPKCLLIDEAQFFREKAENLAQIVKQIKKENPCLEIHISSLKEWLKGIPCEVIEPLEKIKEIKVIEPNKAYCYNCEKKAEHIKKIKGDPNRIQQTEKEGAEYSASCVKCYEIPIKTTQKSKIIVMQQIDTNENNYGIYECKETNLEKYLKNNEDKKDRGIN